MSPLQLSRTRVSSTVCHSALGAFIVSACAVIKALIFAFRKDSSVLADDERAPRKPAYFASNAMLISASQSLATSLNTITLAIYSTLMDSFLSSRNSTKQHSDSQPLVITQCKVQSNNQWSKQLVCPLLGRSFLSDPCRSAPCRL